MNDFMGGVIGERKLDIGLEVFDGAGAEPEAIMFSAGEPAAQARHVYVETVDFYGHKWTLRFTSLPGFDAENATRGPWVVLASDTAVRSLRHDRIFVKERSAQLEAANKELESFSYSVSHDLRSPLRAVDGFSRILVEDHGPRLDDEGRRVIQVIRDGTQKMERLIDDLLAFSRLGRVSLAANRIDMEALAREVFTELASSGAKCEFMLKAMPPAFGDRALVRQVWVNLLSNAIKLT